MSVKRLFPQWVRIGILLAGTVCLSITAMPASYAITSVDELSDVNQNAWAYEALRDLVEKYDVIEGYPDATFRGGRTATRWEMAAALNALIKSIGRDLARLGAEKADKSDLDTLAKLQEEFKQELISLQARTDALEARASAIEAKNAEQDQRLTLLERTIIHGDASVGGLADFGGEGPGDGGIRNAISAVARLRLTLDVPVKEDNEDSKFGAGVVSTRLIAAIGRYSPVGGAGERLGSTAYPFNLYSRVAADVPGSNLNEGLGTSVLNNFNGGTNTRMATYVESLFYKQHLKSGIPLLTDWTMGAASDDDKWTTTGDFTVGVCRWWDYFDISPYRGDEMSQFQNNAFINIPGIAINVAMPMMTYT